MSEDTQEWPDLDLGEEDITNSSDACFRNVNPKFFVNGVLSSAAFMPTQNDDGELSTARSSKVNPRQHYEEFTRRGLASSGVYSVTTDDIQEADLRWIDNDSLQEDSLRMTGHAYIDYRIYSSKGARKKRARLLAHKATRVHSPDSTE